MSIYAKAIIHCGDQIELLPGYAMSFGASMDMYIKPYNCANVLFRVNNGGNNGGGNANNQLPNKGFDYDKLLNKVAGKKINSFLLYPNPNNGSFTYVNVCDEPTSTLIITDIAGKIVYVTSITNNSPIDFVFDTNYKLLPLAEVEYFYNTNKHLPSVPSEQEVKTNGINTAEMDAILLQKIEELTLYIVQQQKEIDALKKEIKK